MSTWSAITEGHISAGNKSARLTSLADIALAFFPALIAVVYLSAGLSFSKENSLLEAQASYALEQRTTLIESEVKAIKTGLERARSSRLITQNPESVLSLMADSSVPSLNVLARSDASPLCLAPLALISEEANFTGARLSRENGICLDFADSWLHHA
jgi:hypothetical protein